MVNRTSEDRWHWRSPNGQGFWSCLHFGDWRVAINQIAIRIMLHHELAGIEPVVEHLTPEDVLQQVSYCLSQHQCE
jgi:hypothetical protein